MSEADRLMLALTRLLSSDGAFAASPGRLERALLDLAPQDERGGRLLCTAARLGVPGLLERGHRGEAGAVLADEAGMRPDVATWVLAVWSAALSGRAGRENPLPVPAEPVSRGSRTRSTLPPVPAKAAAVAAEAPGVPLAVKLALWPDGRPLLGIVTADGVFVATALPGGPETPDRPAGPPTGWSPWRRVGTPSAPASRDVAVAVRGAGRPGAPAEAVVTWSEKTAVFSRRIARDDVGHLTLTGPEVVAAPESGTEPRNPLATLFSLDATLDVIWTVDRSALLRSTSRPGLPGRPPQPLPEACAADDHLRGLEIAQSGARSAMLVALSGRRGLLLSEWDLSFDDVQSWRPVRSPLTTMTALARDSAVFVAGLTAAGDLLVTAAAGALNGTAVWEHLEMPEGLPDVGRLHAVAATGDGGDRAWLVAVGARGGWIAPLLTAPAGVCVGQGAALPFT